MGEEELRLRKQKQDLEREIVRLTGKLTKERVGKERLEEAFRSARQQLLTIKGEKDAKIGELETALLDRTGEALDLRRELTRREEQFRILLGGANHAHRSLSKPGLLTPRKNLEEIRSHLGSSISHAVPEWEPSGPYPRPRGKVSSFLGRFRRRR